MENQVVAALLHKSHEIQDRPIEYAGFGTGGSFQDFVIIAKTLAQKPDAILSIHLIDPKFTPYVKICDLLGHSRSIDQEQTTDFLALMDQFIPYARKNWGAEQLSDAEIEQNILGECLPIEEKMRQFVSFLKKMFPQATLSLSVHENGQSYLDYRGKQHLPCADVLTAVDIEDEMSLLAGSTVVYARLCKEVLKNNPIAETFG